MTLDRGIIQTIPNVRTERVDTKPTLPRCRIDREEKRIEPAIQRSVRVDTACMEPPGQPRGPIKIPGFASGYAAVIRQVVGANITPKPLCAFFLPQSRMSRRRRMIVGVEKGTEVAFTGCNDGNFTGGDLLMTRNKPRLLRKKVWTKNAGRVRKSAADLACEAYFGRNNLSDGR